MWAGMGRRRLWESLLAQIVHVHTASPCYLTTDFSQGDSQRPESCSVPSVIVTNPLHLTPLPLLARGPHRDVDNPLCLLLLTSKHSCREIRTLRCSMYSLCPSGHGVLCAQWDAWVCLLRVCMLWEGMAVLYTVPRHNA